MTRFVIHRKNSYETANWFSKLTYAYLWDFFIRNFGKDLTISDLERCPKDEESGIVGHKLCREWESELSKGRNSERKASLLAAIHRVFGLEYGLHGAALVFTQGILPILQTVVMGWLVKQLTLIDAEATADVPDEDLLSHMKGRTYMYGSLLIALQALFILLVHPYYFATFRIGMDVRVACCHLIYRKSLRLSQSSLSNTTVGQIVNLLSNDVNRFDWLLIYPHFLIIGPLMTIVTTLILYYMEEFGNECLPGIAILLLYIPFQSVLGKVFTNLREKTAALTDERVRVTNEFVKAIKVIKMYAWEEPFCKIISDARKREVQMIKRASFLRGLNLGLFFVATKIIMFIMLFLYVGNGKLLNSSSVFVAMSLVNQLRTAVCLYVPYAVSVGAESLISIRRIEQFLLLPERSSSSSSSHLSSGITQANGVPTTSPVGDHGTEARLELNKVTASYDLEAEDDHILTDISMSATAGELIAVVGQVGSGKTSILMTILNELPILSGSLLVQGVVSYAPQEAWIVPGTIRDNITFGSKMDARKYETVVRASALERDFSLLKNGDKTLVGDTGLSGGQKARVNLARALYREADIYLLDDPLSAVDAGVASHIFDQAIRGYLKEKIVVLITHQLQFVKSASKILLLKSGRQQVFGNYGDLLSKGVDFIKFNPAMDPVVQHTDISGSEETAGGDYSNSSISSSTSDRNTGTPDSGINNSSSGAINVPVATVVPRMDLQRQVSTMSRASIRSRGSVSSFSSAFSRTMSGKRGRSSSWKLGSMVNPSPPMEHLTRDLTMMDSESLFGDGNVDDMGTGSEGVTDSMPQSMEEMSTASAQSYAVYLQAGGGCTALLLIIASMCSTQVLFTFSDWWLSVWTDFVETSQVRESSSSNTTTTATTGTGMHLPSVLASDITDNMYVYVGQTVLVLLLAIARTFIFFVICMRASVRLHDRLFQRLSRAPILFFDTNPVGILLNRCSRDMGIIDDLMPSTLFDAMSVMLVDIGCAVMIIAVDAWIAIPTFIILFLSFLVRKLYINTARSVKRLEGMTRSPVFTHLATSVKGISTIRAFDAEERFSLQFDVHQDNHSAAWFTFLTSSRWFGVTLDWLCVLYITAITIAMLATLEKGSFVGLVITSAILLQSGYQWAIRQTTEVETQMTSVERVDEYSHLESEGFLVSANPLDRPSKDWPTAGAIELDNVSMRYSPKGNAVLSNIRISIRAKEKVGIVGRTGAGKSSIINALFRLTEVSEGSIIIDGIDISTIGLHELRKKISIIPQEPVLFSGTIRANLDPFHEKSDGKVWRALDEVHLRQTVQDISKGLEAFTSEEKQHFSVGQRQLLCLARAILRANRILILDEATANVDPKTDAQIQQTIRSSFAECTVLTIAHRLDTIIDVDRVLVLDAGRVVEFDEPIVLMKNEEGLFASMCRATGKDGAKKLQLMAQKAADLRAAAAPHSLSLV